MDQIEADISEINGKMDQVVETANDVEWLKKAVYVLGVLAVAGLGVDIPGLV